MTILKSFLPCFQIEELLKIIMKSSLPWFQIEELPKTKVFHRCQSDAVDVTSIQQMSPPWEADHQRTMAAAIGDKATGLSTRCTKSGKADKSHQV